MACIHLPHFFEQLFWVRVGSTIRGLTNSADGRGYAPFPEAPFRRHFDAAVLHAIKSPSDLERFHRQVMLGLRPPQAALNRSVGLGTDKWVYATLEKQRRSTCVNSVAAQAALRFPADANGCHEIVLHAPRLDTSAGVIVVVLTEYGSAQQEGETVARDGTLESHPGAVAVLYSTWHACLASDGGEQPDTRLLPVDAAPACGRAGAVRASLRNFSNGGNITGTWPVLVALDSSAAGDIRCALDTIASDAFSRECATAGALAIRPSGRGGEPADNRVESDRGCPDWAWGIGARLVLLGSAAVADAGAWGTTNTFYAGGDFFERLVCAGFRVGVLEPACIE